MASLIELREQLDEIDSQLVELYEKRMEICRQVGEYKIATGKQVYDEKREIEKIQQVTEMTACDFNKKGIAELFELLMTHSRNLQYQMMDEKE